jgi:hypothetical protein
MLQHPVVNSVTNPGFSPQVTNAWQIQTRCNQNRMLQHPVVNSVTNPGFSPTEKKENVIRQNLDSCCMGNKKSFPFPDKRNQT